jgi:hypothetical protein
MLRNLPEYIEEGYRYFDRVVESPEGRPKLLTKI